MGKLSLATARAYLLAATVVLNHVKPASPCGQTRCLRIDTVGSTSSGSKDSLGLVPHTTHDPSLIFCRNIGRTTVITHQTCPNAILEKDLI
jgi:hypothetical protein